jgi:glycosyltransferase involved in cell wall biosynthesis
MGPKVSICIPAYKQIDLLQNNLKAIINQSFVDYEVIITDDSPNTDIERLVIQFNTKKIKYFHNSPPLGAPANWNYGISKATGKYLKILHHDDFFSSKISLQAFVDLLDNNPTADFCFSSTDVIYVNKKFTKKHKCKKKELNTIKRNPSRLLIKNVIGSPSNTIIRRSAFQKFDCSLKWLVDVDWYIKLINANCNIVYNNKSLIVSYHGTAEQITGTVSKNKNMLIKEHIILLERYSELLKDKLLFILFQILFKKYYINSIKDIKDIYDFNSSLTPYFQKILIKKKYFIFHKKIYFWLRKLTIEDYLYLIKNKINDRC